PEGVSFACGKFLFYWIKDIVYIPSAQHLVEVKDLEAVTASRQQWCLKESNRWHLSLFVAWEQRLDAGA
ncbi:hypothetical protein EUBHAL_02202, partial [Anaerobutyricum hallii DSM 3353]